MLRLGGYPMNIWASFAASLPELDLHLLPALPQLGELLLWEFQASTDLKSQI